jgi:hypothetical protein
MPTVSPVPATKVFALGRFTQPPTAEQRQTYMPKEVPATLRLILSGHIEQFWLRRDWSGVVFLMNVPTTAEAHALLEALPLGQAKLMEFDLIPVGPLVPLAMLLGDELAFGQ